MNGKSIHVVVVCSFCKAKLFANSNTSTGHLLRHQKTYNKSNDVVRV
jgi:hypothetical protein